jgi:hypothetical protein
MKFRLFGGEFLDMLGLMHSGNKYGARNNNNASKIKTGMSDPCGETSCNGFISKWSVTDFII